MAKIFITVRLSATAATICADRRIVLFGRSAKRHVVKGIFDLSQVEVLLDFAYKDLYEIGDVQLTRHIAVRSRPINGFWNLLKIKRANNEATIDGTF